MEVVNKFALTSLSQHTNVAVKMDTFWMSMKLPVQISMSVWNLTTGASKAV
jgi:hypothetical protein